MKHACLLTAVAAIHWGSGVSAAPPADFDLEGWHSAREARLEAGMVTLLGWGAASVAGGLAGRVLAEGRQAQGFWEMTAGWGFVNAGLAVTSLLTFGEEATTRASLGASLEASHDLSTVFWLNAGLDVGWMAMGAWLQERGRGRGDARAEGFGQAVVIQGAALLAFDVVMGLLESGAASDLYPIVGQSLQSGHPGQAVQTFGLGGHF